MIQQVIMVTVYKRWLSLFFRKQIGNAGGEMGKLVDMRKPLIVKEDIILIRTRVTAVERSEIFLLLRSQIFPARTSSILHLPYV